MASLDLMKTALFNIPMFKKGGQDNPYQDFANQQAAANDPNKLLPQEMLNYENANQTATHNVGGPAYGAPPATQAIQQGNISSQTRALQERSLGRINALRAKLGLSPYDSASVANATGGTPGMTGNQGASIPLGQLASQLASLQ